MSRIELYRSLAQRNIEATQTLHRIPEPSGVTDDLSSVLDFQKVTETNLASNYAVTLDMVYRNCTKKTFDNAIDICCGPGHFSLCLAKYLGVRKVTGIDLSKPMITLARANSKRMKLDGRIQFVQGDACDLAKFSTGSADLFSFPNSAHHLASLTEIKHILKESDRITSCDGIVFLSDLSRLKTKEITHDFVALAGSEFNDKGMDSMYRDFYNSMHAAWLPEDIISCVPSETKRVWVHFVPKGLSFFQVLIGLPIGQESTFVRSGIQWDKMDLLISDESRQDFAMMMEQLRDSASTKIDAKHTKAA